MAFEFHDAITPIYGRGLNVLLALLDKAEAHVASGAVTEQALMETRLAPDMRPFPAQIQMASDSAKGAVGRLSGQKPPVMADDERTLAELKSRVRATLDFVKGVDGAAFAGAEGREVTMKVPSMELAWTGAGYLTSFALPNFYFHVSMAYACLRHAGVPLGKPDFLGQMDLIHAKPV